MVPLLPNAVPLRANVRNAPGTTSGRFELSRCTKPRISQNASPLMQLPPELRLKIFRLVFKHSGYLTALSIEGPLWGEWASDPMTCNDDFPMVYLSAQSLACCQSMYQEAWSVLYGENTLSIVCTSKIPHYHTCYVLATGIPLHCAPEDMSVDNYDLLSLAQQRTDQTDNDNRFVRYYDSIAQVQNIDLRIAYSARSGISMYEDIFVACRAIRKLVRDKHVSLMLLPKYDGHGLSSDHDLEDRFRRLELEAHSLKGCRIFRCRSLTFLKNKSDASDLVREVEGNTKPPEDIFATWKTATDLIIGLPRVDRHGVQLLPDGAMKSIDIARGMTLTYDVCNAYEHIARALEQASLWTKRWVDGDVGKTHLTKLQNCARLVRLLIRRPSEY